MKNIVFAGLASLLLWNCKSPKAETLVSHKDTVQVPDPPPPALSEEEIQHFHNAVDNELNHTLFRTRFNGAILIAKNGIVVYEKYIGFTDPRGRDSIKPGTPFQIASTSKTLTSAAVLQLIQEGRLSLQDKVTKFFPAFPYTEVTVKMLLDHRSGLPNYLYYVDKYTWDKHKEMSNADVLNSLINWHPTQAYRPGIHFNYCNTNFVLLALIVEKVSGQTFPVYMKQHIFDPLGMKNTFVHYLGDSAKVIQSFQPSGRMWALDFSDGPYGDKNVYSTPEDLLKWDQSLYGAKILNRQMLDSAFTPYSNERPGIKNYGLGWRMLILPNKKKVIYHNGHWHGFNSAFARLTDEKATIIILSNRFNSSVYTTAKKLYNLFGNYDGKHEDNGEE